MEDYSKTEQEAIVLKKWEESTIQSDFVFSKTMEMYPKLCKKLIEYILKTKIEEITYPEREKTIKNRIDSKGVRLDVYVKDNEENVFDLEMQVSANSDNLAKRMRYYQGAIDGDNLKRGEHYSVLKPTYIIFICPFAPFEDFNRHIYTFQERCKEEPSLLLLGSATNKIILSTKGTEDDITPELKNFLDYVETGAANDDYTKEMNNAVRVIKNNEKARLEFMSYEMNLLEREINVRNEMSKIISQKDNIISQKDNAIYQKDMEIAMLKKQIAMMSKSATNATNYT